MSDGWTELSIAVCGERDGLARNRIELFSAEPDDEATLKGRNVVRPGITYRSNNELERSPLYPSGNEMLQVAWAGNFLSADM